MTTQQHLAPLKKLLRSRDIDRIMQGVELAVGLDDPVVWDSLLEGVVYEEGSVRPPLSQTKWDKPTPTFGRLVPGGIFEANSKSMLWDELAIALLVSRVQHPLRAEVVALSFSGGDWKTIVPTRVDGFEGFPNLRRLELVDVQTELDLSPLAQAPALTELVVRGRYSSSQESCLEIAELRHLESVTIGGFEVADFRNLPALTEADLHCRIDDRSGLAALRKLHLTSVTELDFEKDCPNIDIFDAWRVVAPRANVPRNAAIGRRTLSVDSGELGEVSTLSDLDYLAVHHAADVSSLAACRDLKILDLRNNENVTDISALEGHPELRMIAVNGTRIQKSSVPAGMKSIVSFAKNPDLEKAKNRPAPGRRTNPAPAKPKLSPAARKMLPKVKRLLTAPDAGSILQGVELVRSIDNTEVWAALLDGVTFTTLSRPVRGEQPSDIDGRLVENKIFAGPLSRQHWLDLALALLVAASPLPLRTSITGLEIGQSSRSKTPIDTYPIGGLGALPELRSLTIKLHEGTTDLTALDTAPKLKRLTIIGGQELRLPSLANVRSIRSQRHLDFVHGGAWPNLEIVEIEDRKTPSELRALIKGAPKLKTLSVGSFEEPIEQSASLQTLSAHGPITVRDCKNLQHLTISAGELHAHGLVSLKSARLSNSTVDNLDFLHEAAGFELLSITGTHELRYFAAPSGTRIDGKLDLGPHIETLGNCGELDGLTHLDLRSTTAAVPLETLANARELRILDIRNATGITDLAPLIGLPELRTIALRGSGVDHIPPELSKIITRAENPDLAKAFDKNPPSQSTKPKKLPVPAPKRSEWEQVESGLATSDRNTALQAVELAASLGDEAVEHLLAKIKLDNYELKQRSPIRLGERLLLPEVAGRLLLAAPSDSAAASSLRSTTKLLVTGQRWRDGSARFEHLEGFGKLTHLVIRKLENLDVDLVGAKVETLSLQAQGHLALSSVPPTLRRLFISRATQLALSDIGDSQIEQLILLDVGKFDCAQLLPSRHLRRLDLRLEPGRIRNLHRLAELPIEELVLPYDADTSPLVGHRTLRRLWLHRRYGPVDIAARVPAALLPITDLAHTIHESALN